MFLQVLVKNTYREREQPHSVTGNYIKIHSKRRNDTTSVVFSSESLTPCDYFLDEKLISMDGVWAGDVEIMASSAILEADIYVATDDYTVEGSIVRDIRWSLLRACPSPQAAIYITNFGCHFQPVISMINSPTPTYGNITNQVYTIE